MTIRIRIDRTRMATGRNQRDYAYRGVVLTSEVDCTPGEHAGQFTTILTDGGQYYSFVDATRPASINRMEIGWDRYQAVLDHEKAANAILLTIAKSVFPELEPATKWPTLWVSIPGLDVSHATKYVEFRDEETRAVILARLEVSR